jgi:hypothetical protein
MFVKKASRAAALAAAVLAAASGPAAASVVEYTNAAAFASATSGLTTMDFEGLGTPAGSFTHYVGGLTTQGVTFTDANDGLYTVSPTFYPTYNYGTGVVLSAQGGYPSHDSTLRVALPTGVTAFGLELGMNTASSPSFVVTLSTGDIFDVTGGALGQGLDFVGFTSMTPLTSISIDAVADGIISNVVRSEGYIPVYDNVAFGTAAPTTSEVPEPATGLILAGSMIGGAVVRRRR